ncbi:efflux RND transporter periplasmic adaptor subunit [Ramlibacter sp. WS9]|uniref:efflux RND transporter periplasmic adaptor subunit n=1 Tax=Ramlibacter sp. WS9 TaxID=1882741 RepID=UPI001143B88C|nr:efflux RND transporter periplasmic adaptor subunit [Ramlibacter sp. WS9]ROZ77041.1 efflux RND transporter periplasmic adaptor subunit [Ramlibacter sp. WS9]
MASKAIYTVVAVVGIAAASGLAWWYQNKPAAPKTDVVQGGSRPAAGAASGPARPPAVEVARVEVVKLTDDAQAVGSLRSRQSVVLRPEVSGRITQLNFSDGARVRRGQLLVQLDDQLPVAQMQQARAELSIAQANHKRNQDLVAQGFISQRSVDESSANLQVAQAKLELARATAARLRIVAPFDGIAGIRNISVGDYLKDGADIVNIEDMDAIFVDFRLPERFQTKVQRGQTALVDLDALPGRKYNAIVQAIDPLVDANGRSVGIRACIDNRTLQLRPGMFARITAVFGERDNAKVIPEEAIVPQAGRQFVIKLVDGPDQDTKIAQRVEVKVGIRRPGRVEIIDGLQPGDVVVTAGQQRVQKDGMPVRVLDLNRPAGGAPAANNTAGSAPAVARPASAPAAASSAAVAAGPGIPARLPAPRLDGPNPCTVALSGAGRPAAATR